MTLSIEWKGVPELKLREATNEWLKLMGVPGWRRSPLQHFKLGIHFRRKETNEEVQDVGGEAVGDNVEAPNIVDPQHVDSCGTKRPYPPLHRVRG